MSNPPERPGASRVARRHVCVAIATCLALGPWITTVPATAHQIETGGLVISHPWARAVPGGLKVTAGYLRIENKGDEADRLIGVSGAFAMAAELHQMLVTADGVAEMRPVTDGIEIAPGAVVELKPAGIHIMFMGLTKTLMPETYEAGALVFEKAGTVPIEFFVQPLTSTEPAHPHGSE